MAIIFNFDDMKAKGDKTVNALIKSFKKNGVEIIKQTVNISQLKRTQGVSFKELTLTTSDSQMIQFAIKQTGDIFKIKVSSTTGKLDALKEMPIKNQHDHELAIKEIADRIEMQRKPFQKKLEKLQANVVPDELKDKMKSTRRKQESVLQDEINQLDDLLQEADKRLTELKA